MFTRQALSTLSKSSLTSASCRVPRSMMSSKSFTQQNASGLQNMYNVFFKNNITYVTYIVMGAIAVEAVYGKFTDFVWETSNRGRLYHHIDWSQFKTDDDDEDDE